MITKRIIPCLDIKNGRVVKGINFIKLKDAGDPVECAKKYEAGNADELTFLDITASHEKRDIVKNLVSKIAENIFTPFTVGGGLRTVEDIRAVLYAGADKVSLNTIAHLKPSIVTKAAKIFGSQCVVTAIDAKRSGKKKWNVFIYGGRKDTGTDCVEWAVKAEALGAGEILLTSMDKDGTKSGFDIPLLAAVSSRVRIPVIASGGAGRMEHFLEVFSKTGVSAALAASIFHYGEIRIDRLKEYLGRNGICVRP